MTNVYTRIAALGAVCGMRSMLGPALIAGEASQTAQLVWGLLAVGEVVADKMPNTPSRLSPGALFGRLMSGGGVGWALCRRAGQPPIWGALLGAGASLVGAFGGYHARKALGEALHLPDPVVAVGEDALAVGIGRRFAPSH